MYILQKLRSEILNNKISDDVDLKEKCFHLEKKEVFDLVSYINSLEADKDKMCTKILKYEHEIKSVKFDFEVLEGLYKNCYDEMMIQEKTINLLRQTYFDNHIEKFNLKLDKSILERTLKERNKSLECCNEAFTEIDAIRDELKEFGRCPNLDLQNEMKCITSQLHHLQHVIVNFGDDVNLHQSAKDSVGPELCEILDTNNSQHTKIIKYLRTKIKLKNGIIKLHKSKTRKLQKKVLINKEKFIILKMDNRIQKEKNVRLETELLSSKNEIDSLNILIGEWQDKCDILSTQLEPLQNLFKEKDYQLKIKREAVQWLEFELNESSRKGSEICCETKQIFGGVKKWLYLVKKERRNLILKIKDLQNINRLLMSQQRSFPCQDCKSLNN